MRPRRWANPNPKGGSGENAYATGSLLKFICGEIRSNNCLGLSEEELTGMATELIHAKTRVEVLEWATTLMLPETFAVEVTQRREKEGPAFEGETTSATSTSTSASTTGVAGGILNASKRGAAAAKRSRRGVNANQLLKTSAASDALKPGRFECGCFATVHNFRSSCANCGRIICEQEADDVCYACGLAPLRCIAYEISVQEGKLSEAAQQRNQADYTTAVERRDRLLEYAQNRAKRTVVIDDQSATLFSPQSAWMSPEERRAAEKSTADVERQRNIELMHRQRGAYQAHMSFVVRNLPLGARKENTGSAREGAAVMEPNAGDEEADAADEVVVPTGAEPLPSLLQKIWYSPDGVRVDSAPSNKKIKSGGERGHIDAEVNLAAPEGSSMPLSSRPTQRFFDEVSRRVQQDYFEDDMKVFIEEAEETTSKLLFEPQALLSEDREAVMEYSTEAADASASPPLVNPSAMALSSRFAVTTVMRNVDDGICLSMHQPWASLLVAGVKRHEGRVWGTTYRGRLWIHAAASQPTNVQEVEEHYSKFVPPGHVFPRHYPTKVLLGCVYVVDCLEREAYESVFEAEERQEESPYSFICVEPKALPFPLPMSGGHKLFTLDRRVHVAARKQLGEID